MLKRNREISKKVTESGHVELAATSPSSGAPKAPWNTVESKRVEYNTQLHTTNQSRHQDIKTIQDYSKLFSNSLQPIKNANLKEPSSPTSHSWKLFFIRQIIIFSSFLPFTKMVKTRWRLKTSGGIWSLWFMHCDLCQATNLWRAQQVFVQIFQKCQPPN